MGSVAIFCAYVKKIVIRNEINHALKLEKIISAISEMIPKNIKTRIKKIMARY